MNELSESIPEIYSKRISEIKKGRGRKDKKIIKIKIPKPNKTSLHYH